MQSRLDKYVLIAPKVVANGTSFVPNELRKRCNQQRQQPLQRPQQLGRYQLAAPAHLWRVRFLSPAPPPLTVCCRPVLLCAASAARSIENDGSLQPGTDDGALSPCLYCSDPTFAC